MLNNVNIKSSNNGIDLTSLLDVIFIFLLVVILSYTELISHQKQEFEDYNNAKIEYEASKETYDNMVDTVENINQTVWIVSVSVPYDRENPEKRTIDVLFNGYGEKIDEEGKYTLNGTNVDEFENKFKNDLKKYIESKSGMPVIISSNANKEKTLYRDVEMMNVFLRDELNAQYSNVFQRESSGEQD